MRAFPTTHRSMLDRIRTGDAGVRRAAFDTLATGYWRPSYHYVRLRWRLTPPDAEDVVQAFFTIAFEKRYLDRFDPAKARFRTFLRVCLDRFVEHDRDADHRLKRGGGTTSLSLDFPGAERDLADHLHASNPDPDAFFRDETIRALCSRTVDALRADLERDGRARAYQVFERYDLAGDAGRSYTAVADALGLSVAQVTNDLHAARRRFRELVLVELRALTGSDEEYRAEARDLFGFEVEE